jgi:hypothetical protein
VRVYGGPFNPRPPGPLELLVDIIGETFELNTDPQWNDWPDSMTLPHLIEALVFYAVLSEDKATSLLEVWNESEGTLSEPLPDVFIMEALFN